MLASVDRTTALELLGLEHDSVRYLIDTLSDEEMTRPDTIRYGLYPDQKLSFQDLLAHLITYEAYTLEAIDAWRKGEKHWVSDAMKDPMQSRDIHYGGIEDRRGQSLQETLDEWEQTQSDLEAAIHDMSDDDWTESAPYPTDEPTNLGGMIEVITVAPPRPMYRHLPVHIPDSDTYIERMRG